MAGAGSGKTAVLTTRIAHLQLKERVGTSNMLALTFTRLAATEMKERVAGLLGEQLAKRLTAGTFHSFCVLLLRNYGQRIGIARDFSVYDMDDSKSILEEAITELLLTGKVKPTIDPWEHTDDPFEKQVVNEYKFRLKRNNAVDLTGLLAETVRLLTEHPDVAEDIRGHYTYWFVDEYQDTDNRQEQIINLVNPDNLFVVGDPSQAIYEWRGARIENILTFEERNPGTALVRMERNYRSTKPILDFANKTIAESAHKSPLELVTDKEGEPLVLTCYATDEAEAAEIAKDIKERHHLYMSGRNPDEIQDLSDVAILCRTNYQVELFDKALQKEGLKTFIVSSAADPLNKFDIRRIFSYMAFICNPKDGQAFNRIINWPKVRMTDLELQRAEMDATIKMVSVAELLKDKVEVLQHWESEASWVNEVGAMWIKLISQLKLIDWYKKQGLENRITDLQRAGEAIDRWVAQQNAQGEPTDPYAFLRWLQLRDIQERMNQEKPEGVQLLTVHASKGLEWDHVYVPSCNMDVFPSKRGDIEEERRLFYVAVTRARETLQLSYYDERETKWGKRKMLAMQPSPFLKVLGV
jgi:DNA helicase-2/ATP-dependent DNA helicase PcrA